MNAHESAWRRKSIELFLAALLAWLGLVPPALAAPADFANATASGGRERLSLIASFAGATEDVGKRLQVYLIALVPTRAGTVVHARDARGWRSVEALPVPSLLETTGKTARQLLPVLDRMDVREIVGTRIYLGYGLDGTSAGTAFDEMLGAQRFRLIHTVGNGTNDSTANSPWALSPIGAQGLTGYFRAALGPASGVYLGWAGGTTVGAAAVLDTAAVPAAVYSGTTLQEAAVDEADLVKTDGAAVFSLDPAGSDTYRRDRLSRRRFDADAADAGLRAGDDLTLPFAADVSGSGLYLDDERRQIVALGQSGYGYGTYDGWFMPIYWGAGGTEAVLVDAADAERMQVRRHLRINARLIGSRRVGTTLYLVLRSYPRVSGLDPWWTPENAAANQTVVNRLEATDVLPTIAIDGGAPQALVDPAACLLQQDNATASADIITIVGIDLAASGHRHAARCFVGGAEAFYMAERSLYLATTRYRYDSAGAYPAYAAQTSTDLHKFALDGLDIVYRGSGNVAGHLGFDQNRKSFRMGEHEDRLRVITQTDTGFGGWLDVVITTATTAATAATRADAVESPGRLSILEEQDGQLAVIGQLPNAARPEPLGKVGEQLYATRFIGARGYLVTYRLTDPLYVLDLSVPSDPRVAGALEVSGYSDYLFPLAENLLLGVGKDAVEDGGAGDGRFAWYQGVKVSLIDVSDPANPRESARAVVGRRGTDATVLHDHHGIALQMIGNQVRIGLPVSLYETPSMYASSGGPSDYFDFTRTELQRFAIDLDTQTLSLREPLASDVSGWRMIENDRALLWNDQVHYYQDGGWRSAPW
jgi:hypothetical protein